MTRLRIKLTGERAELGVVPAADVANLLLYVETVIARAASVVAGRPKMTSGRYDDVVAKASRLRLIGIETGSVVPVLELPEPDGSSDTLDTGAATLGDEALSRVLDAFDDGAPNPVIAKAVVELAEKVHIGDRYDAVTFQASNGQGERTARLDGRTRSRLRSYIDQAPAPPVRSDEVTGVLVEADFETRTARLRTAAEPVSVTFEEYMDDAIHRALRQPAVLSGQVVYDPKTSQARSVTVARLVHGEQLVLGVDPRDFWREHTFEELAREQGAGSQDIEALYDADASDEERDAFMAALAEL